VYSKETRGILSHHRHQRKEQKHLLVSVNKGKTRKTQKTEINTYQESSY